MSEDKTIAPEGKIVTVVIALVENGYLVTGKKNNGGDSHFVAFDIDQACEQAKALIELPELPTEAVKDEEVATPGITLEVPQEPQAEQATA